MSDYTLSVAFGSLIGFLAVIAAGLGAGWFG